jgi:hypothetical protein
MIEPLEHAEAWALAMRDTHRPHRLMKTVAGVVWETISYPWAERGRVLVCVRVPGDPTTLITVDALAMDPEGRDCYCNNPIRPEFYFVESEADAARRARDVEFLTKIPTTGGR